MAVRLTRNHRLPDGNKRLAWGCLTLFRALNDRDLQVPVDEAVRQMLAVASGEVDEAQMATWLTGWIGQPG